MLICVAAYVVMGAWATVHTPRRWSKPFSFQRGVIFLLPLIFYLLYLGFTLFPKEWYLPLLLGVALFVAISWISLLGYRWRFRWVAKLMGRDPDKIDELCERVFVQRSCLMKEYESIRALGHGDITSVNIASDTGPGVLIHKPELIAAFKKHLRGRLVRLSLPQVISEYGDQVEQLKLQIHTEETALCYVALVHPKMTGDIILMPAECSDYGGIRLPGLKRWLDENVLSRPGEVGQEGMQ